MGICQEKHKNSQDRGIYDLKGTPERFFHLKKSLKKMISSGQNRRMNKINKYPLQAPNDNH